MTRAVVLLLSLDVLAHVAWAAIGTNKYLLHCEGTCLLDTADGKLRWHKRTWQLDDNGASEFGRWYIEGTRIKSSMGQGYLAYDPSAQDPRLTLAAAPGRHTEWAIKLVHDSRDKAGQLGTIHVANGPMKGWSICLEEVADAGRDDQGKYRAVLAPKGQRWTAERIIEHR